MNKRRYSTKLRRSLALILSIALLVIFMPSALAVEEVPDTLDVYLTNQVPLGGAITSVENPDGTVTLPRTLVIGADGVAVVTPITLASSVLGMGPGQISLGAIMPQNGRYTATLDADGVVVSLERNLQDWKAWSVEIDDNGELKIGVFVNDNRYTYSDDAKVYLCRINDAGDMEVQNLTLAGFTDVVKGYESRMAGLNHEIDVYAGSNPTEGVEIFVMANESTEGWGWGLEGKSFEFVSATVSDATLDKYDVPQEARPGARTLEGGLYDPTKNGHSADQDYPLFIFMHGMSGGRDEQWRFVYTESVMFINDDFQSDFDEGAAYVLLPRANEDSVGGLWGDNYRAGMIELIKKVVAENNIDPGRIYLSGFSMGSMMTWRLAHAVQTNACETVPFKFAAIAPVSGSALTLEQRADLLATGVPTWVFFGKHDALVTINAPEQAEVVEQVTDVATAVAGTDVVRLTVFNTVVYSNGFTPQAHAGSAAAVAMNLRFGGPTPSDFVRGDEVIHFDGDWPEGGPDSVELIGPVMPFYGTVYEATDGAILEELGADAELSTFSNTGTFGSWLNKWRFVNSPDDWAIKGVEAAVESGLVPDSVINGLWLNPTNRLAAAEAMVMLIEALIDTSMEDVAAQNDWDLSTNHFADTDSPEVTFLRYAGVVNGIDGVNYDPTGNYTRGMYVTMLGQALEAFTSLSVQGENPFIDAMPDYAVPFVGYFAEAGILKGDGGGIFSAYRNIKNQEIAVLSIQAFDALLEILAEG